MQRCDSLIQDVTVLFRYRLPLPSNVMTDNSGPVHGRVRYSLIRYQTEHVIVYARYSVKYGGNRPNRLIESRLFRYNGTI